MIGSRFYFFENEKPTEDRLLSMLNQYYTDNIIPDELLIPMPLTQRSLKIFEKVLKERKKASCRVRKTLLPEDKPLFLIAEKNAKLHFEKEISKGEEKKEILKIIQRKFHLKKPPLRMECYDISHWQGKEAMGSQVVFEEGKPLKKDYRLYKLKKAKAGDDFEALKEVLTRRLKNEDMKRPDLLMIDGGKGQLSAAFQILKDLNEEDLPLVSLAKSRVKDKDFSKKKVKISEERFFIVGRKNPVQFPSSSKAGSLLLFLRDEAHRFAITSHRKKREKLFLKGDLDEIKGLGLKTKKKLLEAFGSVENIKKARIKDLEKQVSKKLAGKIYKHLSSN